MDSRRRSLLEGFIRHCRKHIQEIQRGKDIKPRTKTDDDGLTIEKVLSNIVQDPMLVASPQERIIESVLEGGVERAPEHLHYFYEDPDKIRTYKPFRGLSGVHDVYHDLMLELGAGSLGLESRRSILAFISEPGQGKTETLGIIRRLLEGNRVPVIKDCSNNCLVLWAFPTDKKKAFEDAFGIVINNYDEPFDICASCKDRLVQNYNYDYLSLPVDIKSFSQRHGGIGIFTLDPTHPMQEDVRDLRGDIKLGGSPMDPHAVEPGALQVAQHGVLICEEMFRYSPELISPLIAVTQEGRDQAPGRLGKNSYRLLVIGTGNREVYENFLFDGTNSPYISRMSVIRFRRNLIISEEINIIRKMVARSHELRGRAHLPPVSLDLLARLLVASSLEGIEDGNNLDVLNRILELYNGANPDSLGLELAWKVRKNRPEDGYKSSLSPREVKQTIDTVLAQGWLDDRLSDDQLGGRVCVPPFALYKQILDYLDGLDRFEEKMVKGLTKFMNFVLLHVLIPNIKSKFIDPDKLEEKCEEIFNRIKSGEFKARLKNLLSATNDEDFEAQLSCIEKYTDSDDLRDFVHSIALAEVDLDEEIARQVEGSDDWCPICVRDVFENLPHPENVSA